jgi:hypothetical protein
MSGACLENFGCACAYSIDGTYQNVLSRFMHLKIQFGHFELFWIRFGQRAVKREKKDEDTS